MMVAALLLVLTTPGMPAAARGSHHGGFYGSHHGHPINAWRGSHRLRLR